MGWGWGVNCYKVIFVESSNDNPSDSLYGWCGVGVGCGGVVWGGNCYKVIFVDASNHNPSDSLCGWCGGGVLTVIKLYLWTHRTITPVTVYVDGVGVRWCANCYEVIFVDSSIDNPSDSL